MSIFWGNLIYGNLETEKRWFLNRLLGQSFFTGLANAFFFVAAYSSMLKAINIAQIPYAYLSSGVGGILLIKLFQRVQKYYGAKPSHFFLASLFAIWLVLLYILNRFEWSGNIHVFIGILGFTFVIPFSAVFALNIGTNCFQVLGVVQGKKWVAKLGIGETLAAMLAFIVSPIFVELSGSSEILFMLGGLSIIPLLNLNVIGYQNVTGSQSTYSLQNKVKLSILWKSSFYRNVIIATAISVMMIYWVDFTYIVSVNTISSIEGLPKSEVVAAFFALVKVGELLGSLFSSNLIRSLTTRKSLMVFASIITLVALLVVLMYFLVEIQIPSLIYLVISLKWFERVFRRMVEVPSNRIMLQVAKPEERLGLQTALEGVVAQVATVLAGLIMLLMTWVNSDPSAFEFVIYVALLISIFGIFWFTRVLSVSKLYTIRLSNYLKDVAAMLVRNEPDSSTQETYSINNGEYDRKESIRVLYRNDLLEQLKVIGKLPDNIQNISDIVDLTSASPLVLKHQVLGRYAKKDLILVGEVETKFNNLLMNVGESLVWIDLTIEDLRGEEVQEYYLYISLKYARDLWIKQLFNILSWKYSADEMKIIEGFMVGDASAADNTQFAMELLDTIIPPLIKPYLLPIFETATLEKKIKQWRQFIPANRYSSDERLKDIVMKDYSLLPVSAKFWALRILKNNPKNIDFLSPFENSTIPVIRMAIQSRVSANGSFLELFENSLDYKDSQSVFVKTELLANWLVNKDVFGNPGKEWEDFKQYYQENEKDLKLVL